MHGSALTWRRAYHYFQMNPEEFYARSHKRANVDATVAAMKKRTGEFLRAKTTTARTSEVYCKVVAYTVAMLVKAMMDGAPVEGMALNPLGGSTSP